MPKDEYHPLTLKLDPQEDQADRIRLSLRVCQDVCIRLSGEVKDLQADNDRLKKIIINKLS